MKKYMLNSIALIAMMFVVNVGLAQQGNGQEKKGPPKYAELVQQMDANKDGKLEKSELKGPIATDFDKIDLNKDGFLSEEELKAAPKPKGPPPSKNQRCKDSVVLDQQQGVVLIEGLRYSGIAVDLNAFPRDYCLIKFQFFDKSFDKD